MHNIGYLIQTPLVSMSRPPDEGFGARRVMDVPGHTLCYVTVLPGWKSGFRKMFARFQTWKLHNQISGRPSVGRKSDVEAFPIRIRPKSCPQDRLPAPQHSKHTVSYPGPGGLDVEAPRGRIWNPSSDGRPRPYPELYCAPPRALLRSTVSRRRLYWASSAANFTEFYCFPP